VQTLSCHCHTYLTGHGSCTEPRLVLAVLVDGIRPMPRDIKYNAHFTNENWAAQKGLLRELTNGSLTVFLRGKLHDTADFHQRQLKCTQSIKLTRILSKCRWV
jgi:hypothetical protein